MMMAGNWSMMLLFLLLNSSARDLLDCLSSQDYWKTKNVVVSVENMTLELGQVKTGDVGDVSALIKNMGSDDYATREAATKQLRALGPGVVPQLKEKGLTASDSEVVDRSRTMIEGFSRGGKTKQIRRLMAIRALGELKKPEALPALRALLVCTDPFVADYAQTAIASIEGKPRPAVVVSPQQLQTDLNLLPPGLGAVAQERMEDSQPGWVDAIAAAAVPANAPPGQLARMTDLMNDKVIGLAEKLGNFRLDAATFGVAKDVGDETGFAVLIARGKYDRAAVIDLLKDDFQVEQVKDQDVYSNSDSVSGMAILLPSDQCLVITVGPSHDALRLPDLVTAIKAAGNKFNQDPELARVVAATDTGKPVWAAVNVNDHYRQGSPLSPFDTVQMTAQRKAGALQFAIDAKGSDATAVKAAVDDLNKNLADTVKQMQQLQVRAPAMKGMVTFFGGIKCQATGPQATMTGTMDNGILSSSLGELMMFVGDSPTPGPAPRAPGLAPAIGPQ